MNITFPLILDGAMGTRLQKAGLLSDHCPEKWIIEHPDVCETIQSSYIDSGSQVIYAPTFGANSAILKGYGLSDKVIEYNSALVDIAKKSAGDRALVAGDISSLGAMLYPLGDMRFEDMYEIYREQALALENAGADLFVIETMTSIPEARSALLAVRSVSEKPVFVTFSCDADGKTVMGTDVCAALTIMQGMGADAFGLNCSCGPAEMIPQIKRLYEYAKVPLIAKPNAGLPVNIGGETVYDVEPDKFAELVPKLAEAGVSIFGACCGSDERYIAAIKDALVGTEMKYPSPKFSDCLPCATEKNVFMLPTDIRCTAVFSCDSELEDNVRALPDGVVFGIKIASDADVAVFSEMQYAIRNPMCLICDDSGILEKALREYQGRALYEGSIPEAELMTLVKKYGLII